MFCTNKTFSVEEEEENHEDSKEYEPDFYEVFLDADEEYQDLDDDDLGLKVLFRDRKRVKISLVTKIARLMRRTFGIYSQKFGHWEEECVNVADYFIEEFFDGDSLGLDNMFKPVQVVWSTPASRFLRDIVRLNYWLTVVAPHRGIRIFRDAKVTLSLMFLALIAAGLCINVTGVTVVIVIFILMCPIIAVFDRNYKNFFECYSEEERRENALTGCIRTK